MRGKGQGFQDVSKYHLSICQSFQMHVSLGSSDIFICQKAFDYFFGELKTLI